MACTQAGYAGGRLQRIIRRTLQSQSGADEVADEMKREALEKTNRQANEAKGFDTVKVQ